MVMGNLCFVVFVIMETLFFGNQRIQMLHAMKRLKQYCEQYRRQYRKIDQLQFLFHVWQMYGILREEMAKFETALVNF